MTMLQREKLLPLMERERMPRRGEVKRGKHARLFLHPVLIPYNPFLVIGVHRHSGSRFLHRSAAITWLGCTLLI